jgi:membrane-bound metal-dependent hydrolase YbcI (DUF457 family)
VADLVTHIASGLLPAALFAPRWMGPLVLGTVLPDATGRVPQMAFAILDRTVGLPMPDSVLWAFDVLHQPLPQVLIVSMVALAFAAEDRRTAWFGMLLGVALHFGLDILQDHHGQGYHLFFPASVERFELGWIGSEATVHIAPYIGAVTLVVVAVRLWQLRRASRV